MQVFVVVPVSLLKEIESSGKLPSLGFAVAIEYLGPTLNSAYMPNGKGSTDWGWRPGPEELIIAIISFSYALVITKAFIQLPSVISIFTSIILGFVGGALMLWANNGWPKPWD